MTDGNQESTGKPKCLGDILLEDGAISGEELSAALIEQRSSGKQLGQILVEAGTINSRVLVHALARSLAVRGCQLRHGLIDPALMKLIGEEQAQRMKAIAMFKVRDELTVAMAEPQSLPTIDRLRRLTGCRIRPILALESEIQEFIAKYSGDNVDVDDFLTSLVDSDVEVIERETVDDGPTTDLDKMVEGSPIINLVNVALLTSIKDKASDIHIEPERNGTRVRYRVDGLLRDLMKPPPGLHAAIISRVKVIGKMDIAEKRLPQEGRVRIVAEGRDIDLRVSSIPTLLGEKIVIRILDKANLQVRLEALGFRDQARQSFMRILQQPHGLVLVTGPTGSGKTTTLYSALDLLRSPEHNIVTVEDPVEYQMDLVNQIHVNDGVGMTFARALRSILRQDPDVIMIGEIRDGETARVAVQAALTGHLVLATLHTNDAPSSIARLIDMDVEPFLLSSALNGVVAQRLARTVCPGCVTKYYPDDTVLKYASLQDKAGRPFRHGNGCQKCHNSGFLGRVGVYEVMEITQRLRGVIHRSGSAQEMRQTWRRDGGMPLREEGLQIALDGQSSLEEVLRVTRNEEEELGDGGAVAAEVGAAGERQVA